MYTDRDISMMKFGYKGKVNIIDLNRTAYVLDYYDDGTFDVRFRNDDDQLITLRVTADCVEKAVA